MICSVYVACRQCFFYSMCIMFEILEYMHMKCVYSRNLFLIELVFSSLIVRELNLLIADISEVQNV